MMPGGQAGFVASAVVDSAPGSANGVAGLKKVPQRATRQSIGADMVKPKVSK
jgi:hypothetical protein